jgi:phosphoribosylamine--glycine ligase
MAEPMTPLPLFARAEAQRERTALVAPEGTFTYADLLDSSARVATTLLAGRADLAEARERAYAGVDRIELKGSHHRSDIALAAELGEIRVP